MGVPKRLTEMQQRFAEFLVFGGPEGPMTQSEAAIAAGYSPAAFPLFASAFTADENDPFFKAASLSLASSAT